MRSEGASGKASCSSWHGFHNCYFRNTLGSGKWGVRFQHRVFFHSASNGRTLGDRRGDEDYSNLKRDDCELGFCLLQTREWCQFVRSHVRHYLRTIWCPELSSSLMWITTSRILQLVLWDGGFLFTVLISHLAALSTSPFLFLSGNAPFSPRFYHPRILPFHYHTSHDSIIIKIIITIIGKTTKISLELEVGIGIGLRGSRD